MSITSPLQTLALFLLLYVQRIDVNFAQLVGVLYQNSETLWHANDNEDKRREQPTQISGLPGELSYCVLKHEIGTRTVAGGLLKRQ